MILNWLKKNLKLVFIVLVLMYLIFIFFILYKYSYKKQEADYIFIKNPENFIIKREFSQGYQDTRDENTQEKLNDYIFSKMGISLGVAGVASGSVKGGQKTQHNADSDMKYVFHEKTVPQYQLSINSDYTQFEYMNLELLFTFFELDPNRIKVSEGWNAYNNFFTTWGSHVLMSVKYGNYLKITYSKLTQKNKKDQSREVGVGAKVPVTAGINVGGEIGLEIGTSQEGLSSITDVNIYSKGSSSINKESLHTFINKELRSRKPIDSIMSSEQVALFAGDRSPASTDNSYFFQFKAIWDILIEEKDSILDFQINAFDLSDDEPTRKRLNAEFLQRISNMKANYFRSILECDLKRYQWDTTEYIQSFEPVRYDDEQTVEYACMQSKTGCVNDDDCTHVLKLGQRACQLGNNRGLIKSRNYHGNGGRLTIQNDSYNDREYGLRRNESNSCKSTLTGSCYCDKTWKGDGSLPKRPLWSTKDFDKQH